MSECCGNRVTIGGVTVDRPSGKRTVANPIAVYEKLTEADLGEFWDFLAANGEIQAAQAACDAVIAAELVKYGKKRSQ